MRGSRSACALALLLATAGAGWAQSAPAPPESGGPIALSDVAARAAELRAWTDHFGDAEAIQSELADAVHAGLVEARIELPVPRRDVRLSRPDDPPKAP